MMKRANPPYALKCLIDKIYWMTNLLGSIKNPAHDRVYISQRFIQAAG
jgi:hypothetical protein